jgi:hypothetical protein
VHDSLLALLSTRYGCSLQSAGPHLGGHALHDADLQLDSDSVALLPGNQSGNQLINQSTKQASNRSVRLTTGSDGWQVGGKGAMGACSFQCGFSEAWTCTSSSSRPEIGDSCFTTRLGPGGDGAACRHTQYSLPMPGTVPQNQTPPLGPCTCVYSLTLCDALCIDDPNEAQMRPKQGNCSDSLHHHISALQPSLPAAGGVSDQSDHPPLSLP